MKGKLCFQKKLREAPNAIDGTMSGTLTRISIIAEGDFPIFLRRNQQ